MKAYKFKVYGNFLQALRWIIIGVGLSFAYQALAVEVSNMAAAQFDNWERASDSELDQLRGGFVLPNGMNIDFSMARITSLNGVVISSSLLQLPSNTVSLIQSGTLNQSPDLVGIGLSPVIIQNNMDNQVIRNVTDINIGLSQLKSLSSNNSGMFFNNYILPNAR